MWSRRRFSPTETGLSSSGLRPEPRGISDNHGRLIAPTPGDAARLTPARIAAALRAAGRQRGVDDLAAQLHTALRAPQLRQPPLVEQAMGVHAQALLAALDTACTGADQLADATTDAFAQHTDHALITSFPGLGNTGGARILAEIGESRAAPISHRTPTRPRTRRPRQWVVHGEQPVR